MINDKEGFEMKRLLILLVTAVFLVACGNKEIEKDESEIKVEQTSFNKNDRLEELLNQEKLSEDDEKELYLIALNSILNKYDEEYEIFDMEAGTNLYKSIKPTANQNVEVANGMKESLVELMDEEQQKVYGSFLDELMELEETFSHLDWS